MDVVCSIYNIQNQVRRYSLSMPHVMVFYHSLFIVFFTSL